MNVRIRNLATGEIEKGIPTPRLAEAVTGEAFFVSNSPVNQDGVWYLHEEPTYVSPDGKYTRVKVERTDDWKVTLDLTVIDGEERCDYPGDWYIVEAVTEREAFDLATLKAREWAEQTHGDVATDIRLVKAQRGVSM